MVIHKLISYKILKMGEKISLLVVIVLQLHHAVTAQKANLCNITESYFVEVTKTETVLGFKKPTGFMGMFSIGNKYENVTKTVLGVEKRERVVEECCKGYKKTDDQCVPIDDSKPSKEPTSSTSTTTTTAATPSSTSTTSAPVLPVTEPAQATSSETSAPVNEPSVSPEPEVTSPLNTVLSEVPVTLSESVTTSTPEPVPLIQDSPSPSTEALATTVLAESTPNPASEIAPTSLLSQAEISSSTEASAPVSLVPSESSNGITEMPTSASTSQVSDVEAPLAPVAETETLSSSGILQSEPMLASIIITTVSSANLNTNAPTTPLIVSLISTESSTSTEPQNEPIIVSTEKSVINSTEDMDSTTIINDRKKRNVHESNSIEMLHLESSTEHPRTLKSSRIELKLNENSVSTRDHLPASDDVVVSDLTIENENESENYPWTGVLEVLSFGAIIVLLVATVQISLDSGAFPFRRGNKKISQNIDSYGEFWIYDSHGNLEEV